MGALKGSISYSRFFAEGEPPEDFAEVWMKRIAVRAFRPLTLEDEALERFGWCSIEHPFDLELEYEKVFYNSYVNLGFRMDRWAIPGPLFKAQFAEAEKAYLAKRGKERLGRAEKEELKAVVSRKLRKQLVPAMRVVDVSWNMESGVVRVFSSSAKTLGVFEDLFEKTFELKLVPATPYTNADRRGLAPRETTALDLAAPSQFATTLN